MAALRGDLLRNLNVLAKGGYVRQVGKAMYEEYSIEAKEVVRRTPVKTGNLRATVKVGGPVYEGGGKIRVWLQAGGGTASDYAIPVHENLDAHHPVGQAKYLESVIVESAPHIMGRVGARVNLREALK